MLCVYCERATKKSFTVKELFILVNGEPKLAAREVIEMKVGNRLHRVEKLDKHAIERPAAPSFRYQLPEPGITILPRGIA
jgi:hypothetical protein